MLWTAPPRHESAIEDASSFFAQRLDEAAGQGKRMIRSDKGNGKHTSLRFAPHIADRFTVRPEYLKAAEHLLRRSKSCARQSPDRKSDAW